MFHLAILGYYNQDDDDDDNDNRNKQIYLETQGKKIIQITID